MNKRIVVLTRNKLIFTMVLLVGVMCPLLVASYLTPVTDVSGKDAKMLTYRSERGKFNFDYPQGWLLRSERDYSGGEIQESVTFASPDQLAHGFAQVMQLARPIPEYIRESEKNMAPGYDSFEFKQLPAGSRQGYLLAYKRGTGEARNVAAEYFFKNNETVYRFCYYYPEGMSEQYTPIFAKMLESLTLPGEQQKEKKPKN